MSILGGDPGGEHYFSSGILAAGIWTTAAHATVVNSAPAGALTTYGISLDGTPGTFDKNLGTNYGTLIQAGRCYIPTPLSTGSSFILMQMFDGATSQVELRVNNLNNLIVTNNGTANVRATSSQTLTPNSGWHYFEWQVTIGTTGSAQVWVDGVQWINASSINTKASANNQVNLIRYSAISSGTTYWKDLVWLDTGTGTNTSRLGDIQIPVIFPNGVGVNQQWTNNGGASQTASVQDGINHTGTWPDGDTSYISDSTTGHISDFAHQALSLTGTIFGVIHQSYMRKDDAGSRSVAQVCLSGGTTETSATISLGNTYTYFTDVIENDPHTATQFTVSTFNAATFGAKEVS